MKKYLLYFIAAILGIYAFLAFLGGGFAKKEFSKINFPIEKPIFFAHRGVIDSAVENSLEALEIAKEKGFNGIEIDVMETSDGELILFHDETGDRLLNQPNFISKNSWEELSKHRLFKNGKMTASSILTLEEAFKTFGKDFVFYLDLKSENFLTPRDLTKKLNFLIEKYDLFENVLVTSSNLLFIGFVEYNYPKINTGLEGSNTGKEWIYDITPRKFRPDFLSSFEHKVDAHHVDWLKKRGLLSRKIVYGVSKDNYLDVFCEDEIEKVIIDYHPSLEEVIVSDVFCQ